MKATKKNASILSNPVTDLLWLQNIDTPMAYTIYDKLGQLLLEGEVESRNYEIDVGTLSSGFYLIRLEGNGQDKTLPFVVVDG